MRALESVVANGMQMARLLPHLGREPSLHVIAGEALPFDRASGESRHYLLLEDEHQDEEWDCDNH
jgi:hypothetical protein